MLQSRFCIFSLKDQIFDQLQLLATVHMTMKGLIEQLFLIVGVLVHLHAFVHVPWFCLFVVVVIIVLLLLFRLLVSLFLSLSNG